jgi:NADP-dependent 3-hydroxy acid dehydrogenase YdfG
MSLEGQVGVITGASAGIGAATARLLHEAGMKLVITARREDRLQALAEELPGVVSIAGDITDPGLAQQLIDKALAEFGQLDVMFNNAGVILATKIEDADIDAICAMVRINTESAFRLMYTALKHFKRVGRGHLINTSSVLGTKVRPTVGAYAGTKFAIEALCESLRLELAKTDILVSCVEPGLVLTELHRDWPVHPKDFMNIQSPLMPADIARCVKFMLEQPKHVRIARMLVLPGEMEL